MPGLSPTTSSRPGPATYTLNPDGRALLPALEQIRCWSKHRTT